MRSGERRPTGAAGALEILRGTDVAKKMLKPITITLARAKKIAGNKWDIFGRYVPMWFSWMPEDRKPPEWNWDAAAKIRNPRTGQVYVIKR
jgi:hypothetical protein